MDFVGKLLSNKNGIEWYYIIGMFIFLSLFILILYKVYKIPKSDLKKHKESIFKSDNTADSN